MPTPTKSKRSYFGYFTIEPVRNGGWRRRLYAHNKKQLSIGEVHTTKAKAINSCAAVLRATRGQPIPIRILDKNGTVIDTL